MLDSWALTPRQEVKEQEVLASGLPSPLFPMWTGIRKNVLQKQTYLTACGLSRRLFFAGLISVWSCHLTVGFLTVGLDDLAILARSVLAASLPGSVDSLTERWIESYSKRNTRNWRNSCVPTRSFHKGSSSVPNLLSASWSGDVQIPQITYMEFLELQIWRPRTDANQIYEKSCSCIHQLFYMPALSRRSSRNSSRNITLSKHMGLPYFCPNLSEGVQSQPFKT